MAWLQEKEAQLLSTSDDLGHSNVADIQALLHRHDAFKVIQHFMHYILILEFAKKG